MGRLGCGHGELGQRVKAHPLPAVVHAAPRGDAVKVADVLRLWQGQELIPAHGEGVFAKAADLQPPVSQRHGGRVAEIEDRPIRDLPLADRQFGHAVTIDGTAAFRGAPGKLHVELFSMKVPLSLDVTQALADEAVIGIPHLARLSFAARPLPPRPGPS